MISSFLVTGMTCSGCAAKVQWVVQSIAEVDSAEVLLEDGLVHVQSSREIQVEEIAAALAPHQKYTARLPEDGTAMKEVTRPTKSAATYWPLILIGLFLSALSTGISWQYGGGMTTWMEVFMGGFFLVFSFFKFLDIKGFARSYKSYDLLASVVPSYGYVYPFFELALGFAWVFVGGTFWVALSTAGLMGFSAIGVIRAVARKTDIQCACLGTVFNLPMSTVTIVEDVLMVGMALAVLIPLS